MSRKSGDSGKSGQMTSTQIPFDFIYKGCDENRTENVLQFENKYSQRLKETNSVAVDKLISHAKSLNW